ncbi:MAG: hypothetical protein NDJ90_10020 [Oligoflexia bacterium]|nr:hypothetical protein [Oligoflexia bacterium]
MREHTWNERAADHRHHRKFRKLIQLHELTLAWIQELKIERAPYLLARGLNPDVTEQLWILDSLTPESRLESLLDDTSVEDVLGRLKTTVWAVQAYTLSALLEKTAKKDRSALDSALEQASWKTGRRTAEEHWKDQSASSRDDLRVLIRTVLSAPFLEEPESEGLLIKRALREEALIEFLACPHSKASVPELAPIAGELCRLHGHWLRGYAYGLNNRIAVEACPSGPRCGQRWRIIPSA